MPDWSGEAAFWLKSVVGSIVLYPGAPMFALALGLGWRRRQPRLATVLSVSGLAVLFAFSLPIVANAIAARDERAFPPLDPSFAAPPRSAIVVLAGGLQLGATDYVDATFNPATLARLRSAARLAVRTGLPVLVTGGLRSPGGVTEGRAMAESLERDFHVPVRWVEDASLDTIDNARRSVPLLKADGVEHALLVTDVSHVRRAKLLFERAGMDVIAAPTDYYANGPVNVLSFLPSGNAIRRSAWTVHEWAGQLWAAARG